MEKNRNWTVEKIKLFIAIKLKLYVSNEVFCYLSSFIESSNLIIHLSVTKPGRHDHGWTMWCVYLNNDKSLYISYSLIGARQLAITDVHNYLLWVYIAAILICLTRVTSPYHVTCTMDIFFLQLNFEGVSLFRLCKFNYYKHYNCEI